MEDEPLSFEKHRRRREETASTVRCAKCGGWIVATANRCPECGVHFQGESQEFAHPSELQKGQGGLLSWVLAGAILLIVAMAVGVLGLR